MPQVGNNILSSNVTVDLATEPVTVTEVKAYGSIAYDDYDSLIELLMKTARKQLETYTDKSFGVKTIQTDFTHSGMRPIRLPKGRIDTIGTLMYRKCLLYPYVDSTEVGLTYDLTADRFFSSEGYYMATYTTKDIVSEEIKTAIKAQTVYLFENREDVANMAGISPVAKSLVNYLIPGDLLV